MGDVIPRQVGQTARRVTGPGLESTGIGGGQPVPFFTCSPLSPWSLGVSQNHHVLSVAPLAIQWLLFQVSK